MHYMFSFYGTPCCSELFLLLTCVSLQKLTAVYLYQYVPQLLRAALVCRHMSERPALS